MWQEFKKFAVKGNALDLAVGVIIGAAFTSVVNSIVNDLLNPILNIFIGHVDFRNIKLGLPGKEVLGIGSFLNALINFLIVAFVVFLVVKQMIRFRSKNALENKECPNCLSVIPIKAKKCAYCTSEVR
jgi:large conductance mechanosensitive channel